MAQTWATRIKVLVISGILATIANGITTYKMGNYVSPFEALPGIGLMFAIICVGWIIQELLEKKLKFHLPTIVYISLLSILASLPGVSPIAEFTVTSFNKVGLLPICTPILAYAGISIGKDLDSFRKQGLAIVIVALCTFLGTYLGSAAIAQRILKLTHVI
jgi:hypothetical protein